ncbi:MAG: MFS transporter [Acetobacteraceae bacterium]|nr:MFS transporter [Acetobacteraceae bacterium]
MQHRRGWIALFLFTLAMINYVDRGALSFAAGPIARELGLSPVTLGYVFSSFLWSYVILLLPAGMLVDRYGAKKVAGCGIGLWSLATAATGLIWSIPALIGTRLVMGAGEATTMPAGNRVIREWIPAGERGMLNSIFSGGSYAGPAVCALVAGPIIAAFGWRVLFFVTGGVGIVWLICWQIWFAKPEEASWLGDAERQKIIAERGARKVDFDHTGEKPGLLKLLGSGPTLWGVALTQGCNVYSQYLFLTWLPSYLQSSRGLTIITTGIYVAIPYVIAVGLCLLTGRASDRLLRGDVGGGRRRYMIACGLMLAAVIMVAPLVSSVWLILGLITLSLTGLASASSLNFALLNDLLPKPRDVGIATAFMVLGGNSFGLIAPIVTGYVIAITGSYNMAFVIAGGLLVIGAVSTLTLTRHPIGERIASGGLPAASGTQGALLLHADN